MKKILFVLSILATAFTLAACGGEEDPSQGYLDAAGPTIEIVIGDLSNVTNDLNLPTALANDVTATYVSSQPGVATVGTPSNGMVTITINRPAADANDVEVTLTVTLSVVSEVSGETVTLDYPIVITVIALPPSTALTIAEVRTMSSGTVTVEGVVLGQSSNGVIAIQDETDGIGIYGFDYLDELLGLVGHNVQVTGNISPYNGLLELNEIANVTDLGAATMPTPVDLSTFDDWDAETLIATQMQLITLNNVLVTAVDHTPGSSYGVVALTLQDVISGESVAFRYEDRVSIGDITFLQAIEVGDYVTITGGVMGWYNAPQVAITNATQITAGTAPELTDAQKLNADLSSVSIEDLFYEAGSFADVANITADNDTVFTWSFTDATDTNNSLVDLTTGAVTLPASGQVEVDITLTGVNGAETDSVAFTLYIGIPDVASVASVKALDSGEYVTVAVVYTGISANRTYSVQDATGGIALYSPSSDVIEALESGNTVVITGVTAYYGGLEQIANAYYVRDDSEEIDTTSADISTLATWDATTLLPYQSMPVSFIGATVSGLEVDDYGNVTFTLTVGTLTIDFKWDTRVAVEGVNPLEFVANGDTVDVIGAPLGWSSDMPRLGFSDVTQIVFNPLNDSTAVAIDASLLTFRDNVTAAQDINLVVAGENGSTISWASDHATVTIANDVATFTIPDPGVSVTLTATVTKGDASTTVTFTVQVGAAAPDLFISEYIEGSSYNKAIELYNPTDTDIDLSLYSIEVYNNGNDPAVDAPSSTLNLTGTLAPGEVYVIYNSSAVAAISDVGDVSSSVTNYNGDDSILLLKNGVAIDVFGVPGEDPGSAWTVGDGTTGEHTLVRVASVTGPSDAWVPTQWIVYAQDTFDYIGSHTCDLPTTE